MILTAHQPAYLPWTGLFHKIALADSFVIFDGVQYEPRGFDNRNRICLDDQVLWLSVPVIRKGHREKPVEDILINDALPWRRKHWKSIQTAYSKAPFFRRYADFFEECYDMEWHTLVSLNEHLFKWTLNELGLHPKLLRASSIGLVGTGSERVLDMCRKLDAKAYVFGEQGRSYADLDAFIDAGVDVYFQDFRHPVYSQIHEGDFISHLSIIDLLFNHGNRALDIIMRDNLKRLI